MFDQNMLNELAKLKVDRKRKRTEEDEVDYEGYRESSGDESSGAENYEKIPTGDEEYEDIPEEGDYGQVDIDHVEDSQSLSSLNEFIGETIGEKKNLDPNKYIGETSPENDYSTDEADKDAEMKSIIVSGKKATKEFIDKDGNEVKSRYMDEIGNITVVYGEPGKNVVNRKSIQEQRLDVKMEALSGLLTKFKTDEEIQAEEADKNVIILDKKSTPKKDLRSMDKVTHIMSDLDMKISMVKNTFEKLSREIEAKAQLPYINFNITSPDYLRALFMKKCIDDMDVSRIFTLALFLESPESFPSNDTFEQVEYRNSQVGAKSKSIDLKRLITYLSSDSEFNNTVDMVSAISKNPVMDLSGLVEVFNFKCRETLHTLALRYLKNDTADLSNRVNIISIKKDIQFKYRNLDSTLNFLESLKGKLKVLPANFKDQIKKTSEQIEAAEEKISGLNLEINKLEKELTIMIMLFFATRGTGYNINFVKNIPKEEIEKQLQEYNINLESELVRDILKNGIKEETFNEILKTR
jgi:hypothetical protein